MKALTVYKASAGTGKTFTLTAEYIALLISNPLSYRNILAVTFTNKATEEMKMRIIAHLYGIANNLRSSDAYLGKIMEPLPDSNEKLIRQRAKTALAGLLHNYNYFQVETIDKFFQRVMRNLARELDLTPNLRIELNDKQVENQAVDDIIDELDEKSATLKWLLEYIRGNIEAEKSWNVITSIKSFGQKIFKDDYKKHARELREKLGQKNFMSRYIATLRQLKEQKENEMQDIADSFFATLEKEGLGIDDFKKKSSGIAGYFIKLRKKEDLSDGKMRNDTCIGCLESSEGWVTKTHKDRAHILDVVETTLLPLLIKSEEARPEAWKMIQSVNLTLKNINELRLLNKIEEKVRTLNDDANRFLLSDTQQILSRLIDDNDSPFIFEKIGSRLDHIMIDEFQDTSTVQWGNFKILLKECMSKAETGNLIVGDVKQSIYRWRSGDWQLLNNIEQELLSPEKTIGIKNLSVNYRSAANIIDFNNKFFTIARQLESESSEQIAKAYDNLEEDFPPKKKEGGLVRVDLLGKEDYAEKTLQMISDTVNSLISQGVSQNDIAILIRKNKEVPLIASYFTIHNPGINIVSAEAFRLDSSEAVNKIIAALRVLVSPEDKIAMAVLGRQVPDEFLSHTEELRKMPLFKLIERLFNIFRLDEAEDQSAYICAFYDAVSEYVSSNPTDIESLLNAWDQDLCGKTIQSAGVQGIRIISIHKSKGLEFDNVIIPFCDWKMEQNDDIWCIPEEAPFNELPLVPVEFSKKGMLGTIYEKDYYKEHEQNIVDNLNLLYVAFTRAGKNLFVVGKKDSKDDSRSYLIQQAITKISEEKQVGDVSFSSDDDHLSFEFGSLLIGEKGTKKTDNILETVPEQESVGIESFENKVEFRQSNDSRLFLEGEDEDEDSFSGRDSYIKIGSLLHQLFSTIRTTEDIERRLEEFRKAGIIYDDNISEDKLLQLIDKRLQDEKVRDWFSDRWTVYNECTILSVDEATGKTVNRRPDRVISDGGETIVIDFKFGRMKEAHKAQVKEYMQLLESMGYNNVKGRLWYVYANKIEEVL